MTTKLQTPPPGYHSVTPYLALRAAKASIDFYKRAFGATELMRLAEPTGKIGHAELQIGSAVFMLSDEYPDYDALSAETLGGSPITLPCVFWPIIIAVIVPADSATCISTE